MVNFFAIVWTQGKNFEQRGASYLKEHLAEKSDLSLSLSFPQGN